MGYPPTCASAAKPPYFLLVSPTGQSLNILLVEDNSDDVFFFKNAFQKAGGSGVLHAVSDGAEALQYLRGDGGYGDRALYPFPDVLLLDLNMPRMNGFEVLEWVRQNSTCRRLIIHVLTSSCREADVDRVYELGANSYVVKPTRVDQLADFVKALHEWHRFLCLPRNHPCEKTGAHVFA
jgi:CheY-like chemotaxis protein